MDYLLIKGGRKLKGTVHISGAKNAALPILFATLLTDEEIYLNNIPQLEDIRTAIALLELSGKKVVIDGSKLTVKTDSSCVSEIPYELVRKMRASIVMAGPLLARYGSIKISLPGGCAIGVRPIDIHLDGFKKLGADVSLNEGYVNIRCKKLIGTKIKLRFPSVGATENLLMASVLSSGETTIENAAKEPEIVDLCSMLSSMGANIKGAGTDVLRIKGVKNLCGTTHKIIPDRIETATYMLATAITKGEVKLKNTNPGHCTAVIEKLKKSGLRIEVENDSLFVRWERTLKPQSIKTAVYPGFPTDVQAQWMALMSTLKGRSVITETIFENRFLHVAELQRLGADLKIDGNKVIVNGVKKLSGAPVMVSDLRAGAALVLAGLAAEGTTKILRIYHLDRGYESLEKKLSALGADIQRKKR